MLTIEDLRDSSRNSGFRHVLVSHAARPKPYQAVVGTGKHYVGEQTNRKYGPVRLTAEEAAQDACDLLNGRAVTPAPQVKRAGHSGGRTKAAVPQEVQEAQEIIRRWRAVQRRDTQGYVYCIAEAEGLHPRVKIGYSDDPAARVPELQTGNPNKLFLLSYFKGTEADEKALHQKYIEDNVLAEWFRPSDALLSEFGFDMYDLYEKGNEARQ